MDFSVGIILCNKTCSTVSTLEEMDQLLNLGIALKMFQRSIDLRQS